jgi:hypothetical protein
MSANIHASRVRLPVGYGLDSYSDVYRLGKPNRIIEYII